MHMENKRAQYKFSGELKAPERNIWEELNSIIANDDPEGLIFLGAPNYEYCYEVEKILDRINKDTTEWELEEVVGQVFSEMFMTDEESPKYRYLAHEIYNWLKTGPIRW